MTARTARSRSIAPLLALPLTLTLGLLAVLSPGRAVAEEDPFSRRGGYLSLGIGGAASMFTGDLSDSNDFVDQALIIGLRGGQRLNRWAAFDISTDYSINGFETVFGDGSYTEAKSLTGFGNLKLYPLEGRFQPYAMGGVGFVYAVYDGYDPSGFLAFSESDVVFAGRAGGGLDVYLTEHVALSAEVAYVIPTGTFSDLNYLQYTGHLLFRF